MNPSWLAREATRVDQTGNDRTPRTVVNLRLGGYGVVWCQLRRDLPVPHEKRSEAIELFGRVHDPAVGERERPHRAAPFEPVSSSVSITAMRTATPNST